MFPDSAIFHFPRPSRLSANIDSRLRSPDIDLETVDEILRHYGLNLVGSPQNLPNTRRNRNLIVRTSAGKRVLKLYRRDWPIPTIVYEHSILARLAELSFPAPKPAYTMDGKSYVHRQSDNYAVFGFIDGDNLSLSFLFRSHRLRLMTTAGQTLGRLHQRLRGFLPDGQHHLGFKSYVDGRRRDMAWHVEKVAELKIRSRGLTKPQDRAHANWLVDHSDELLEELDWLGELLRDAPLPRVIIHGDYGLHNLMFQGPDRATPVDFELARLEWRLCDLVSVVSKFRYRGGLYDFESIRRFMLAYRQEYPIGDEEWHLFPLVWKHYKLMKAVQYWSSYFETGGPARKLASARDEIEQARWALDNPRRLSEFKADM